MSTSLASEKVSINALPPAITSLGEAPALVTRNLRQALEREVEPSGQEFVMPDDLGGGMTADRVSASRVRSDLAARVQSGSWT